MNLNCRYSPAEIVTLVHKDVHQRIFAKPKPKPLTPENYTILSNIDCMSDSDLKVMLYEPKHARNVAVTSPDPAPLHRPGHKVTLEMR